MEIDKWSLIALLIMIISFVVGTFIYYRDYVNECTKDPLAFASIKYEKLYNYPFIGEGFLVTPLNVNGFRIMFSSNGSYLVT